MIDITIRVPIHFYNPDPGTKFSIHAGLHFLSWYLVTVAEIKMTKFSSALLTVQLC
eukprot:SAG31_NODE_6094_length_2173_cov_1.187078_1_plen_55_part_10